MEPPEMEPPAQRLQRYFKEQLAKFGKTPFVIPFAIGISAAVYYLVVLYGSTFCLSGLLTPLLLIGICWYFGIKSIKKLLLIGMVASLVFAGVLASTITDQYQHIHYKVGTSDDRNATLKDGALQPLYGDKSTVYEFSVTVYVKDNATTVKDITVEIQSVRFPSSTSGKFAMTERSRNVSNNITGEANVTYAYDTTLSTPVNSYVFRANVSDVPYLNADYSSGQAMWLPGPMSKDTNAILGLMLPLSLINTVVSVFPLYALIVVMIWWTRRTRKMRKDQMEKWEEKRAKEEAKKPKEDVKVSLQRKAMGLEDEGTFVCSECGADVPAAATVCPKCGEKFE
jgi:uncharacterized membrane protein